MIISVPFCDPNKRDLGDVVALQIEAEVTGDYAIHRRHIYDSATGEITINDKVFVVSYADNGAGLYQAEQKFRAAAYVEAMQDLVAKYGGKTTPKEVTSYGREFTIYIPDENFIKAHREAREIANAAKRKTKKEVQEELQGSLFDA